MRIGYISTFPPIECGIATYTQALEDAVRSRSHETFVASYAGAKGPNVFPVVVTNDSPRIAADLFSTTCKLTPDVVHIQHEYGLFGPQRGAAVCDLVARFRIARIPVVTTLHTVYDTLADDQQVILRHLLADSSAVIVHEGFQKETLERTFGPQPSVHVIEHGVRERTPVADAKSKLGLSGKKVVMLCGYFRRTKGFHKAAAFLPELCAADPDVVLVMAGKVRGNEALEYQRELFDELRSTGCGDRIVFLRGQFPQHTFDTVLSAADVIVLPYDLGAQSGMLSQCLALRRPVVTSDLPAFRALIERSGAGLVSESDDDYARTILRLLDDEPLRRRMQANAARYVRQQAGWSRIAARHVMLYDDVIAPFGTGRYVYFPEPEPGVDTLPGGASGFEMASGDEPAIEAVNGLHHEADGFSPPIATPPLRNDGRNWNGSRGVENIPR